MSDNAFPAVSSHAYRVLLLDAAGRVLRTKIISAFDEVEAIARARAFMDGRPVELWDGVRRVLRLDASDVADG